jgi:phytoene dehydrogenase-like protein
MTQSQPKTLIIIGAGIAGLATGVYAQKNGYNSQIHEMHSQPGGLMTAWKRKGYTIDGCIHWLTGSNVKSNYYRAWRELGILQRDSQIVNPEVFSIFESSDGKKVYFYTNIDRLERHLIEIGPADSRLIHELCQAARKMTGYNPPLRDPDNFFSSAVNTIKSLPRMASMLPALMKFGRMSIGEYARQYQTQAIREMLIEMWMEDMSAGALVFVMAYLHDQNAGYPIGGSLPMAHGIEKKYLELGGQIHYNSQVEKILVEDGRAVGIRLVDGSEIRADYVISAADGHATIFDMLEGKFVDEKIRKIYDTYKPFPAILLVGLGVNRKFDEIPAAHGGISFPFKEPIQIGPTTANHLDTMIYNFDPTLAPEGKTLLTAILPTTYTYWKELSAEPEQYKAEKERIGLEVIQRLEERFAGISAQVEMADVATPMTFERYTGNWQGSFEGFLPTPGAMTNPIPRTLPGLANFYMVGQWVQAGGGLPSGLMTALDVVGRICKVDGKKMM